jgi:DNA-binding response OmpR family regulator
MLMGQSQFAFQQDIRKAYILIAISNQEESSRVHEVLRQAGFSLFSFAFTGEAALAWAKQICPDLQILSSHYPDMKGLDLYSRICQARPEPPASALFLGKRHLHIETESGHRIICLETPYTSEQLLKAVETLLCPDRKRLGQ